MDLMDIYRGAVPFCARCCCSVQAFNVEFIPGGMRFTALCHGAREIVDVRDAELEIATLGAAFAPAVAPPATAWPPTPPYPPR